jgi:hypothetical protein
VITVSQWSVLVDAAAPEGETAETEKVLDAAAELGDMLDGYAPSTAGNERTWSARVVVEADDPRDAIYWVCSTVLEHAHKAGLPDWPLVNLQATRWDVFEAELDQPTFPALVGAQEVTEMLGVSRQRLHELRSSGRFPGPIYQLAATPVWLQSAIESFLEAWDRRPGRPARVVAYDPDEQVTIVDVAERLGVTPQDVIDALDQGRLRSSVTMPSGERRVRLGDVNELGKQGLP